MLNIATKLVKVLLVAALTVAVGVASHKCGERSGRDAMQKHAVAAGIGAHLLDISSGQIVFCWLTPFGPVPYYRTSYGIEQHGVSHVQGVSHADAPKCEKCCPCCDCGCQKGGPCKCEGKSNDSCGPCCE